jgi:hypothetical protein
MSLDAPMMSQARQLPALPEIGHPESFYAKKIKDADKAGDKHTHEAYKVGQYITLALDTHLAWEEKLRYFQHALKRHCQPPFLPDDELWTFYNGLAALVREYAGREALRLASETDDLYAARLSMGQSREDIEDEAEEFFSKLIAHECPAYLNEGDYDQLKLIRDQWI